MRSRDETSYAVRTDAMNAGFQAEDVLMGFLFNKDDISVYIPDSLFLLNDKTSIMQYVSDISDQTTAELLSDIIFDHGKDFPGNPDQVYLEGTYNQAYIKRDSDHTQTLYSYGSPVMQINGSSAELLMADLSEETKKHVNQFAAMNGIDPSKLKVREFDFNALKKEKQAEVPTKTEIQR